MEEKVIAKGAISNGVPIKIVELENGWKRYGYGYLEVVANTVSGHIVITVNRKEGGSVVIQVVDDSDDLPDHKIKEMCLEHFLKIDNLFEDTFFYFIAEDSWLCAKDIRAVWQK